MLFWPSLSLGDRCVRERERSQEALNESCAAAVKKDFTNLRKVPVMLKRVIKIGSVYSETVAGQRTPAEEASPSYVAQDTSAFTLCGHTWTRPPRNVSWCDLSVLTPGHVGTRGQCESSKELNYLMMLSWLAKKNERQELTNLSIGQ